MSSIRVTSDSTLEFNGKTYRCAVGKKGFAQAKREGDNCTPIGSFPLRECWYRADKIPAPETKLPLRIIQKDDGWCDASEHLDYNKHVKLPFAASHENLWREDDVYDVVVPLGYNDNPTVSGKGSAIFMHVAKLSEEGPGYEGTEGCVALSKDDLLEILISADATTLLTVSV